jgi:hypothetical protein
MRPLAIG